MATCGIEVIGGGGRRLSPKSAPVGNQTSALVDVSTASVGVTSQGSEMC